MNRSFWWILGVIVLDQITKWWVAASMKVGESISVLGTFFQITSHRNRGAAFGILQNQRWFFVVLTLVIVGSLALWWWRTRKTAPALQNIALLLMIGGAIGNWLDRTRMGEVVDFFHFHFQWNIGGWAVDYVYPLFNIADSAIVIGAILLCWAQLFLVEPEVAHESTDIA